VESPQIALRGSPNPSRAAVAALVLASLGCSDRPLHLRFGDAEAPERPAMQEPPAQPVPGCRPNNTGCPTNEQCLRDCDTVAAACRRSRNGFGGQDAVCTVHEDCQAGFACVRPIDDGGTTRCLRHCRNDGECADRTVCVVTRYPCNQDDPSQYFELRLCQMRPRRQAGDRDGG
jgi:hypothetical protein